MSYWPVFRRSLIAVGIPVAAALSVVATWPVAAENFNPFAEREGPELTETSAAPVIAAAMTLRGTLLSAGESLANIDGVLYGEGDAIGQYVVSEISSDSVTLSRGDAEIALLIDAVDPSRRGR